MNKAQLAYLFIPSFVFLIRTDVNYEMINPYERCILKVNNKSLNFETFKYFKLRNQLSFLEIIRPGGERLVDELMISEELNGKELRSLAREYLSNLTSLEILYNSRQSSLFDCFTTITAKTKFKGQFL